MDNIPDITLALRAAAQEGRQPQVVSHSWWKQNAKPDVDYLVLQDDTWKAWVRSDPDPDQWSKHDVPRW